MLWEWVDIVYSVRQETVLLSLISGRISKKLMIHIRYTNELLTNVFVKGALAAAKCLSMVDDRTKSMSIHRSVDVEAISLST